MKSYQNRIDIVSFEPETTTSSYLACLFRPDLPVPVRIRFGAGQNLIFGPARSKFKLCETLQSSQTFFFVALRTSPFQGASASRGFPKCHFQSLVVPIMALLWPHLRPSYLRPTCYDLRATYPSSSFVWSLAYQQGPARSLLGVSATSRASDSDLSGESLIWSLAYQQGICPLSTTRHEHT